jgi:hypothetical protein
MSARLLLRLLTLLLGSFYLGGVCELDAAECRQNYAKECHEYVAARVEVDVPAAVQAATPAAVLAAPLWRALWTVAYGGRPVLCAWARVANPPPPVRRLYLRYAVLQV